MKENVIEPIQTFMRGPQKGIYELACKFVQVQEPNFTCVESDEASRIKAALADLECFKGNKMQQVKALVESLQAKLLEQVYRAIESAKSSAAALHERLQGMAEFMALSAEQQLQIEKAFTGFVETIEKQTLIEVIRDNLRRGEEVEYQRLLARMSAWALPKPETSPQPLSSNGSTGGVAVAAKARIEYVTGRSIRVPFHKAWLADESDVESYLKLMHEAMLREIHEGKRIQI
jgi:hypothetical protein